MAIQFVSLSRSSQPLRNVPTHSSLFEDNLRFLTETLFKRVKQTPELVSMLDTAVTDHFCGPVDFFDANGGALGPTKLKQVKNFWSEQNVQGEAFAGQGLDYFMDGSSFGWHVSVNQILTAKQKEAIIKLKALNSSIGDYAEEQSKMPRRISYLAASTVTIKHDEHGELYYV